MPSNGIRVVLTGVPRTKKSHNRIVRVGGFNKILPSKAHEAWFKAAMTTVPKLQHWARKEGFELPLKGPVEVRAIFYRDAQRGDLLGFLQAIADWMQAPVTRLYNGVPRVTRQGAGIICDDVQIVSWDGSRLEKDAANPRVDIIVRPFQCHLELTEEGAEGGAS